MKQNKGGALPLTQKGAESFVESRFKENVILVSVYKNRRSDVDLKCLDCGHEWSTGFNNISRTYLSRCPRERYLEQFNGKDVPCAICGKLVYRTKYQIDKNKSGRFYCSRECGNLNREGTGKGKARVAGEIIRNSSSYRRDALEHYPHHCAVCGYDEDVRILEVHHIDENRENNELDNLIILCPTCHWGITLRLYDLYKSKGDWFLVWKTKDEVREGRSYSGTESEG